MSSELNAQIAHALEGVGLGRRDRVFAVARAWYAANGNVPSIIVTREYVGKGSNSDIARDLKEFAAEITERTQRRLDIPVMPAGFVGTLESLGAGLWQAAFDQAKAEFEGDRSALEARTNLAEEESNRLTAERQQALIDRQVALEALAESERKVNEARQASLAQEKKLGELGASLTALETQLKAETSTFAAERRQLVTEADAARHSEGLIKDRLADMQTMITKLEKRLSDGQEIENAAAQRANHAESALALSMGKIEVLQVQANKLDEVTGELAIAKADGNRLRGEMIVIQKTVRNLEADNGRLQERIATYETKNIDALEIRANKFDVVARILKMFDDEKLNKWALLAAVAAEVGSDAIVSLKIEGKKTERKLSDVLKAFLEGKRVDFI